MHKVRCLKGSIKLFFSFYYYSIIFLLFYHHDHLKCVSVNDRAKKTDTGLAPYIWRKLHKLLCTWYHPCLGPDWGSFSVHKGNKTEVPHALASRIFFFRTVTPVRDGEAAPGRLGLPLWRVFTLGAATWDPAATAMKSLGFLRQKWQYLTWSATMCDSIVERRAENHMVVLFLIFKETPYYFFL